MRRETKAALTILITLIAIATALNEVQEISVSGFRGEFQAYVNYFVTTDLHHLVSLSSLSDFVRVDILSTGDSFPGLLTLYVALTSITGLSAQQFVLLPFGVAFTGLSFYVLARRFFTERMAVLLVAYISLIFLTSIGQLGGYVAAFTTILFFLIIFAAIFLISDSRPKRWFVVFLSLYLGLFTSWHTMEARAMFFLFAISTVALTLRVVGDTRWKPLHNYFFLSLIVTLIFKQWLYDTGGGGYFAAISVASMISAYQQKLAIISSILLGTELASTTLPWYVATQSGEFATISRAATIFLYLLIVTPIGLAACIDVRNVVRSRSLADVNDISTVMMWSLLLMKGAHFIAYGLAGQAGPGMIRSVLVLATVFSLYKLTTAAGNFHSLGTTNPHTVASVMVVVLILVAGVASVNSVNGHLNKEAASYSDLDASASWYGEYVPNDDSIGLADFDTRGKLLSVGAEHGLLLRIRTLRARYFVALAHKRLVRKWDYLLIDTERLDQPIDTDEFRESIKPMSTIDANIRSNTELNLVYSDGAVDVYARSESEHPHEESFYPGSGWSPRYWE